MGKNLTELLKGSKKEIIIIGVLPIEKDIIENSKHIVELFYDNPNLKLKIYHESDSDLFVRSLYLDSKASGDKRISFKELQNKISRIDRLKKSFLSVEEEKKGSEKIIHDDNLVIRQLNLRHTKNIIKADDKIYTSDVLLDILSFEDYQFEQEPSKIGKINNYIDFISENYDQATKKGGGVIYLSDPNNKDDELIEMYDKDDIPRGIFPRKAFYNTDFQRYSVWIFVFNRKGQLMLHKRASHKEKITKDNAGLWDKSAGGHVDIKDRSSNEAAEREIIEEMYLADAEHTKYLIGNTQKFINLGEWRPIEREEEQVLNLFARMKNDEWGYFFLKPCVKRVSRRRFLKEKIGSNGELEYVPFFRDTKFISDIFFFIAPKGEIDDNDALKNIPSSAADERKLYEIRELLDFVEEKKEQGNAGNTFTDDLIYIVDQYKDTLLAFTDYIKFQKDKLNA